MDNPKYTIKQEPDHSYKLYRYGELCTVNNGRPNNPELQFWFQYQAQLEENENLKTTLQTIMDTSNGAPIGSTLYNIHMYAYRQLIGIKKYNA